jgi:hypothetical protein
MTAPCTGSFPSKPSASVDGLNRSKNMSLGRRFRVSRRTRPMRVLPDARPRVRRQDRDKRRVCQLPLLEKGLVSPPILTTSRTEKLRLASFRSRNSFHPGGA